MIGPLFAYRVLEVAPGDLAPLPPALPRVVVRPEDRRCYRCADCLDVVFAGESCKGVACGACGGSLEYQGRVSGARLVDSYQRCACDGRCTGAIGPSCDCSCGGKNHGTGREVTIRRDCGPAPKVAGQRNVAHLATLGAAWRATVAELREVAANLPNSRRHAALYRIAAILELRSIRGRETAVSNFRKVFA